MSKIIIGIDPDTDESGFAVLKYGALLLYTLPLWKLFEEIDNQHLEALHLNIDCVVRLEAGHKDKRTWHKGGNGMAKRVGACSEIGKQIEKYVTSKINIKLELVKPCGYSQITHETFCNLTGWDKKVKTNSEKRVAGMLAFSGRG